MNWDKFDLHFENIVPGIIISFLCLYLMGNQSSELRFIQSNETAQFTVFIAMSYIVGVLANITSRMLVDTASKKFARERVFRFFLSEKLRDLINNGQRSGNDEFDIHKLYSSSIDSATTCGSPEVVSELMKRRQTGRLVRASLMPGWIVLSAAGIHAGHYLLSIILVFLYYFSIVYIYAFAECTVFQEALRGVRIKNSPKA